MATLSISDVDAPRLCRLLAANRCLHEHFNTDILVDLLNIENIPFRLTSPTAAYNVKIIDESVSLCEMVQNNDNTTCCVCLSVIAPKAKLTRLRCGHNFHRDCIDTAVKYNNSCPLCRQFVRVRVA